MAQLIFNFSPMTQPIQYIRRLSYS